MKNDVSWALGVHVALPDDARDTVANAMRDAGYVVVEAADGRRLRVRIPGSWNDDGTEETYDLTVSAARR